MNDANYINSRISLAESGDIKAQLEIGLLYCIGGEIEKDDAKGFYWLNKAAEQGDAAALSMLGALYHYGQGVEQDYNKSIKIFTKLANQGDAEAQYELGRSYFVGDGVEKNDVEAIKWYMKAAEQGHIEAEYMMGLYYLEGEYIEKDQVKGIELLTKTAEQGFADAQHELANCYRHGDGVKKDDMQAVKWYRKAARQDFADAQYELAHCYHEGEGVRKNPKQSLKWLTLSAEQGFPLAQYQLGVLYEEGLYVKKDLIEAARLLTLSAEQGRAEAQFRLSMLYFHGDGVERDMQQVWKWLEAVTNNSANIGTDAYEDAKDVIEKTKEFYSVKSTMAMNPKALVITEGSTDWRHMEAAMSVLRNSDDYQGLFNDLEFEFLKYEPSNKSGLNKLKFEMGDSELLKWCDIYSKCPQLRKTIFIADNDNDNITKRLAGVNGAAYKSWGNNVFSFTLPIPEHRKNTPNICIEHLYTDNEIMTELEINGVRRRLYMGYEFDNNGVGNDCICGIKNSCGEGKINIIENKIYSMKKGDNTNLALSKMRFAESVLSRKPLFDTFNFDNFLPIFETIRSVLDL